MAKFLLADFSPSWLWEWVLSNSNSWACFSLRVLDDKALPKLITFDEGDEEDRGGAGPELPPSVKKMCLGAGAQVWTII